MRLNKNQQRQQRNWKAEREAANWRMQYMILAKKYMAGGMDKTTAMATAKKQARLSNERKVKGK